MKKKMFESVGQYFINVRSELAKVTWPSKGEVKNATTLVIVFSIIFAIIVSIFDLFLEWIVGVILNNNFLQ